MIDPTADPNAPNCNIALDGHGTTYGTSEWLLRVCAPLGTPCAANIKTLQQIVNQLIVARQKADGPCPICGSWQPNMHLGHGCMPVFRVESEELPDYNSMPMQACPKCHAGRFAIATKYTPVYEEIPTGMVVRFQKQIGEYFQRTCTECEYAWKESTTHAPKQEVAESTGVRGVNA